MVDLVVLVVVGELLVATGLLVDVVEVLDGDDGLLVDVGEVLDGATVVEEESVELTVDVTVELTVDVTVELTVDEGVTGDVDDVTEEEISLRLITSTWRLAGPRVVLVDFGYRSRKARLSKP